MHTSPTRNSLFILELWKKIKLFQLLTPTDPFPHLEVLQGKVEIICALPKVLTLINEICLHALSRKSNFKQVWSAHSAAVQHNAAGSLVNWQGKIEINLPRTVGNQATLVGEGREVWERMAQLGRGGGECWNLSVVVPARWPGPAKRAEGVK